jgi:hypothetical protein
MKKMKTRNLKKILTTALASSTLLTAAAAFSTSTAFAEVPYCSITAPEAPASVSPATYQRDMLSKAASIYMTPHGQGFLTNSVVETLIRNGVSLEEGDFAKWAPPGFDTIHLDSLSSPMQKFGPTLGSLRDTIKKWLIGFQFNDPKISLKVQGINYKATIKRLGLRTDPLGTMKLGRENSIILDMEMEIPAVSISVGSVLANDANNSALGTFGVNQFTASMADSSKPLKFRVPILVSLDAQHNIQIKATAIETNLQLVDLDWDFAHPLVLPTVQVSINGKTSTLSYDQLEQDIHTSERSLAKAAQTFLKNYLSENGPKLLNDRFAEAHLNTLVDEVSTMPPIGAPDGSIPPSLVWGLQPESLKLDQHFLEVDASAFVIDPTAQDVSMAAPSHADTPADLSTVDPTSYDMALSLDESFVNRLLQLSFGRGYFASMKNGDTTYKITEAPTISADPQGQKNHVKLHAAIETSVPSPKSLGDRVKYFVALRNPLRVSFDMDVKIEIDLEHNLIKLVESSYDLDSMQIDPSSVKHGLNKQDLAGVKQYFQDNMNVPLQTAPSTLATLPIPTSIAGIPIRLNTVEAQSNGHFVLFLNYGDAE